MRYIIDMVLIFAACVLQIGFADAISIKNIVPDFSLIALCAIAMRGGRRAGALFGFLTGLLMDSVSGGLFGAGPLVFTVTGFVAGSVLGYRSFLHIYELLSNCALVFLGYFLFAHVVQFAGHPSFWRGLATQGLPSFLYTLVMAGFMLLCFPRSVWRGRKVSSDDIFGNQI